jgi:hypothetical protein
MKVAEMGMITTIRSKWQTPGGEPTTFFETGNTLSINRKYPHLPKKGDPT